MWSDPALATSTQGVKRQLRVCYFLPHHNVTGGMKMLIKHIDHLKQRGHWVMAAFRGPLGSPVLPPWATSLVKVDEARLISPHESITSVLPAVDIVMIGYFTQLLEFRDVQVAPGAIVYWDQGHEHVFGDPTASPEWDQVFHLSMHLPIALLSVSNIVRDILAHHFARSAPVVPNAIDTSLFYPKPTSRPHPHHVAGAFPVDPHGPRRVLLVGNPGLLLKNFDTAFAVLTKVQGWLVEDAAKQGFTTQVEAAAAAATQLASARAAAATGASLSIPESGRQTTPSSSSSAAAPGSSSPSSALARADVRVASPLGLHVTWMCQARPAALPPALSVSLIVNPPQEDIPDIYRSGFDCILFCSAYEAWGMPVLEAMASGVPVVTSLCHGVDMFASHRYNCLAAKPFDVQALSRCLFAMLTRPTLQATFTRRALDVARRFSWDAAMTALEKALYQVDRCLGRGGAAGSRSDPPPAASEAIRRALQCPLSAPPARFSAPPRVSCTGGPGAGDPAAAKAAASAASKVLNGSAVSLPSAAGLPARPSSSGSVPRPGEACRGGGRRRGDEAGIDTPSPSGALEGVAGAEGDGPRTAGPGGESVRSSSSASVAAVLETAKGRDASDAFGEDSASPAGGGTAAPGSSFRRVGPGTSTGPQVGGRVSSSDWDAAGVAMHRLDPTLEHVLARVKALMDTAGGSATLASLGDASAAAPLSTEPTLPAELFPGAAALASTALEGCVGRGGVSGAQATGSPPPGAARGGAQLSPAALALLARIMQTPAPASPVVGPFPLPLSPAAPAHMAYLAAGGVAGGAGLVMPHAQAAALATGAGVVWAQPQHMPMAHHYLLHPQLGVPVAPAALAAQQFYRGGAAVASLHPGFAPAGLQHLPTGVSPSGLVPIASHLGFQAHGEALGLPAFAADMAVSAQWPTSGRHPRSLAPTHGGMSMVPSLAPQAFPGLRGPGVHGLSVPGGEGHASGRGYGMHAHGFV